MRPSATHTAIGEMIDDLPDNEWDYVISIDRDPSTTITDTIFVYALYPGGKILKRTSFDSDGIVDENFVAVAHNEPYPGSTEGWLDHEVARPLTQREYDTFLAVQALGGNTCAADWLERLI